MRGNAAQAVWSDRWFSACHSLAVKSIGYQLGLNSHTPPQNLIFASLG